MDAKRIPKGSMRTPEEVKAWCEDEGIDFTQHTQWHLCLHDTLLKIKVDIWPSKYKYHIHGTNEYRKYFGPISELLHKLFIVPAEAENAKL